jgi:NAD(P)-dependent dehydrogenase (short-subunit alcohol dehydrogenase family)
MGLLDDRVALVTAAGGAIGGAIAVRLASEGARVACADLQVEAAQSAVDRVHAEGGEALAIGADVLEEHDCRHMVEAVRERYGKLDVLCNLVGYFGPRGGGPLDEVDLQTWQWMMDINLKSVFMASKWAIPEMLERGGAIINTGTIAAVIGRSGGAYGAAKSGVLSLTRAMASDYRSHGIRVNCVCPSATDTPMYWAIAPGSRQEAARTTQGLSSPEQIASVFLFLASPLADRVNGQILVADGGFSSFRS